MKLTVFAGTFNPIHIAHLIIAESVRDTMSCEKIMFIPSYNPPHKENDLADAHHRFNMVKLAIADNPYFEISDIEFKMQGISYTINTIRKLYEEIPDIEGKINFIIGTDAFKEINSWHESEELVKLVNFVIIDRADINISSSYIRERIKKGQSIKYLVSESVKEYIYGHKLYT
ncbi:MAG: nicotinate (nicotinamide) nucleotide adenylyltransferase [Candidatus Melainabacteria bacterium GWF2_37_15]|nr:MAG: nicotinate (nicotinamide) nucleotide adenylyltransferase [Candidatus Melainabacteria bacterium GWF2_37_15]